MPSIFSQDLGSIVPNTLQEEDAAPVVAEMTIPVIAFIAGASAPEGRRVDHDGSTVAGDKGIAQSKKIALRSFRS